MVDSLKNTNEQALARRVTSPPHLLEAECLGCNSKADFTFQVVLKGRDGSHTESETFGGCFQCCEPGKPTYEGFKRRVAYLMWQGSNVLGGSDVAQKTDYKTLASGGE